MGRSEDPLLVYWEIKERRGFVWPLQVLAAMLLQWTFVGLALDQEHWKQPFPLHLMFFTWMYSGVRDWYLMYQLIHGQAFWEFPQANPLRFLAVRCLRMAPWSLPVALVSAAQGHTGCAIAALCSPLGYALIMAVPFALYSRPRGHVMRMFWSWSVLTGILATFMESWAFEPGPDAFSRRYELAMMVGGVSLLAFQGWVGYRKLLRWPGPSAGGGKLFRSTGLTMLFGSRWMPGGTHWIFGAAIGSTVGVVEEKLLACLPPLVLILSYTVFKIVKLRSQRTWVLVQTSSLTTIDLVREWCAFLLPRALVFTLPIGYGLSAAMLAKNCSPASAAAAGVAAAGTLTLLMLASTSLLWLVLQKSWGVQTWPGFLALFYLLVGISVSGEVAGAQALVLLTALCIVLANSIARHREPLGPLVDLSAQWTALRRIRKT